ncbi:DNA repair and recombination protein RadB [Candidatus Pacearchaeota archaeon]|nr:DNA repair and recombination protein RadB [Candidatus Pacearchaeota archaeon]|tara:strand:- start:2256 stop:2999 length:744 start_codon:yes stop_codon:yes gene_type:complete
MNNPSQNSTNTKIPAGNQDITQFLAGGYEKDIITTLYGPAGCGKTNFCMFATAEQANKNNKVIFIDTEGGFSIDRFNQLLPNNNQALKNILLLKPTNFEEQKKAFTTLSKELKTNSNISLIIVDGMTMLYRLELSKDKDDNTIYNINKELAHQLRTLNEIARKKLIPIIITNQIYYTFQKEEEWREGKERTANIVGGDILKYWSKCLIELQNRGGRRKIILKKHRSLPEKELQFIITNSGIRKRGLF